MCRYLCRFDIAVNNDFTDRVLYNRWVQCFVVPTNLIHPISSIYLSVIICVVLCWRLENVGFYVCRLGIRTVRKSQNFGNFGGPCGFLGSPFFRTLIFASSCFTRFSLLNSLFMILNLQNFIQVVLVIHFSLRILHFVWLVSIHCNNLQ